MPDSEAKRRWIKENTTTITLRLNHRTDADILAVLSGGRKQAIIKDLIRQSLSGSFDESCQNTLDV